MEHKKDYINSGIIGFFFGLFSIPILKNIEFDFLPLNLTTYAAIVIFFTVFAIIAIWIAIKISKKIPVIFEVAKFAAVGAFNTFLDWGVSNALILLLLYMGIVQMDGDILGISDQALGTLKGISFLVATTGSYFWQKYWTFKSEKESTGKEFLTFLVVSGIGMAINILVAVTIKNINPFELSEARAINVGFALATIASLVWNFLGYKFVVFKKK